MPLKFATIPFEEIMKRLFKSGYDSDCYRKLANIIFHLKIESCLYQNMKNLLNEKRKMS